MNPLPVPGMNPLPPGTGLCVIEMQNDLVHPSRCDERGLAGALARAVRDRRVIENLAPVIEACRARGAPVLYPIKVRHPSLAGPKHAPISRAAREGLLEHGSWGAQITNAVAPTDGDIVLPRFSSLDPSHGGSLWETAANLGLSTLLFAGVSTTVAVEGTVRGAANRGYRCVVLEDCCASVPETWHRFSADNVLPLLGDVVSSAEARAALG
jgi:ureidoacrylate peracid hydrolase